MEIGLLLKIAGIGMLVTVICQVLSRAGRDDQATFVSVAGILLALFLLMEEIGKLFSAVESIFGL